MIDGCAAWWATERKYDLVLALLLASICAVVFALGVPRMVIYGHDVFVSLDGAWRVLHGQRPQVDFYAQMGPIYYLLHAAGITLAGGDARGLGYGTTIFAIVLAAWSFFLLRGRMAGVPRIVACVALLLLAIAPFPLGLEPWYTSFSMKHNRYGFALTGLVFLECFLPPPDTRRSQFGGAFSSGLACAVLLFLKISYGMVALALIAASVVLRPRRLLRAGGVFTGLVCFTLPMLAWLRFDLPAMAREYGYLADAQKQHFTVPLIVRRLFLDRFEILPVLLLVLLTTLVPGVSRRRVAVLITAAALAVGGGTLLVLGNTQFRDLPLMAILALLLVNELTLALLRERRSLVMALLSFGLLAIAVPAAADAAGLTLGLLYKLHSPTPDYRFHEAHLRALRFVNLNDAGFGNDNGRSFVQYTEEGIELLRTHGRPDETVRGLGMTNPFSYALLRRPSRGGCAVMTATDVSAANVPPLSMLVGDSDLLLLPTYRASGRETFGLVLARYPELLTEDYGYVANSPNWELYRRKR